MSSPSKGSAYTRVGLYASIYGKLLGTISMKNWLWNLNQLERMPNVWFPFCLAYNPIEATFKIFISGFEALSALRIANFKVGCQRLLFGIFNVFETKNRMFKQWAFQKLFDSKRLYQEKLLHLSPPNYHTFPNFLIL